MRLSEVLRSLPDFRSWGAGQNEFDVLDYAMCTLTVESFCAVASLLGPELIVHDGEYFLKSRFDLAAFEDWHKQLNDSRQIQRVMNHLHIRSLFRDQAVSDRVAVFIADEICRHWDRSFAARGLASERVGATFDDVQVTLCRLSEV